MCFFIFLTMIRFFSKSLHFKCSCFYNFLLISAYILNFSSLFTMLLKFFSINLLKICKFFTYCCMFIILTTTFSELNVEMHCLIMLHKIPRILHIFCVCIRSSPVEILIDLSVCRNVYKHRAQYH